MQQQLVQYEGGQHSTSSNSHQLVKYRNSAASKSAASNSATSHSNFNTVQNQKE